MLYRYRYGVPYRPVTQKKQKKQNSIFLFNFNIFISHDRAVFFQLFFPFFPFFPASSASPEKRAPAFPSHSSASGAAHLHSRPHRAQAAIRRRRGGALTAAVSGAAAFPTVWQSYLCLPFLTTPVAPCGLRVLLASVQLAA